MPTEIVVALIGATASCLAAWLISPSRRSASTYRRQLRLPVLALGLSMTAIAVSLFNLFVAQIPQLTVEKTTVTAHTANYYGNRRVPQLLAPNVPADAQRHVIDLACEEGYKPLAAWHEIVGSHPSLDKMYSVNAEVEGNGVIALHLRARENEQVYAYVEVFVVCSRLDSE